MFYRPLRSRACRPREARSDDLLPGDRSRESRPLRRGDAAPLVQEAARRGSGLLPPRARWRPRLLVRHEVRGPAADLAQSEGLLVVARRHEHRGSARRGARRPAGDHAQHGPAAARQVPPHRAAQLHAQADREHAAPRVRARQADRRQRRAQGRMRVRRGPRGRASAAGDLRDDGRAPGGPPPDLRAQQPPDRLRRSRVPDEPGGRDAGLHRDVRLRHAARAEAAREARRRSRDAPAHERGRRPQALRARVLLLLPAARDRGQRDHPHGHVLGHALADHAPRPAREGAAQSGAARVRGRGDPALRPGGSLLPAHR